MIQADVIIVGGGPAGSACARRLRQHKLNAIILDQHHFPRFKPCAGWITPEVLRDVGIAAGDYPLGLTTFRSFAISLRGLRFKLRTLQHAIRRIEFDHWLLDRSGAPVYEHTVKTIVENGTGYEIDGQYCAPYLVGAGGTHCPVYRTLFKGESGKPKDTLIVAQEEEFRYDYPDDTCYLWFLEDGLPGYSWYVPKAGGWLNVGVGGKAEVLKANGDSLKNHWNRLVAKLETMGLVRDHSYKPAGHSYYLRQPLPQVRRGNALLAGDSAGFATRDMGEGIGPAIRSGTLAADAIAQGGDYSLRSIQRYSIWSMLKWGFR
jgi:flavin-dependent dehydrogenase